MRYWHRNGKRFLTDAAGYGLLVAAVLTGWLPGPGGIPLAMAGLGMLSIHNKWAHDLREFIIKKGGNFLPLIFPDATLSKILYDILTVVLFTLSSVLVWTHAARWQISLAIAGYFLALTIVLMNRDRAGIQRRKRATSANQ